MQEMWQLPFFLLGMFLSLKNKKHIFFLVWFLISPLAASFVSPNPHALRSFPLVIPVIFFTALGISLSSRAIRQLAESRGIFQLRKISPLIHYRGFGRNDYWLAKIIGIVFILFYFSFSYLHIYYVHYPNRSAPDWSSGAKELVSYLITQEKKYRRIVINKNWDQGYIYLLFYGREFPGPYQFVSSIPPSLEKDTLYVTDVGEERKERKVGEIYDRKGDVVFRLWAN